MKIELEMEKMDPNVARRWQMQRKRKFGDEVPASSSSSINNQGFRPTSNISTHTYYQNMMHRFLTRVLGISNRVAWIILGYQNIRPTLTQTMNTTGNRPVRNVAGSSNIDRLRRANPNYVQVRVERQQRLFEPGFLPPGPARQVRRFVTPPTGLFGLFGGGGGGGGGGLFG